MWKDRCRWRSHGKRCSTSRGSRGSSCPRTRSTRFQEQLSAILEAVSKVSELDLSDVPPTSHPLADRERVGRGRAAAVPAARRRVRERARPRRRLLPDAAGMTRSTRSGSRPRRRAACSIAARSPRASSGTPTAPRSTSANERAERLPDARRRARRRRRADRAQGRDLDEGHPHDRRLEDPRELRPRLRRDRRRQLQGGRAAGARQDEHRRVRDGLVDARTRPTGPTRNPWDPDAASRAARAAARRPRSRPGSRRGRSAPTRAARSSCPSAFCGNVGLRPDLRHGLALRRRRVRLEPRPGRAR